MTTTPLILLAAGGTGGHLFPAEALGVELIKRGYRVRLATDSRALRYSGLFSKDTIDVVPSETVRGRTPWSLAYTGAMLVAGTAVSLNLMRKLKPAAVVGFGGYPTVPPLLAARLFGIPGIIHEANAVLGRANRLSVEPRQCDCDLVAGRARPRPGAVGENDHRRHADASHDPCGFRGELCIARTERIVSLAGGRRQSGRAGDGRYCSERDRASGAFAVEQAGSHPASARRRHGTRFARSMTGSRSTPNWRRSSAIFRRGWHHTIW